MSAKLTARLEELRAARVERLADIRRMQEQRDLAQKAPERLSNMLAEAFAAEDRRGIARLTKELDGAKTVAAEPWDERVKGAQLRAEQARQEVQAFAAANYSALLEERRADAEQVHRRQIDALTELVEADRGRGAFVAELTGLMRDAGMSLDSLRDEPLAIARDARLQLTAGVPVAWPASAPVIALDRPPSDVPEAA